MATWLDPTFAHLLALPSPVAAKIGSNQVTIVLYLKSLPSLWSLVSLLNVRVIPNLLNLFNSILVSAKQYVGNPIDCIHSKDIPEEVLNTYCWIHSTYTIPSAFWKRIGFDVAHPGVDKTIDPEERRYHKYYQWVCFCLFFQVRLLTFEFSCIYI